MTKEIWKIIPGFEGVYEVSNLGRIRSLDRYIDNCKEGSKSFIKGKIMYGTMSKDGYHKVHFSLYNKTYTFSVHRLVAQAFIPNPDNLPEINHINEDKTDNRVENLEWCDHNYNIHYGTALERSKKNHKSKLLLSKKVNQLTLDGELVRVWPSLAEIHRQLGYSCGNISQICSGKYQTAYGFKWSFA